MSLSFCNVDGRVMPAASVTVPLLDRGFLFGDSIYEVVRTHRGRLFGVDRHFARLEESARRLGFVLPIDEATVRARIDATLAEARHDGETYVRIIVTRGVGAEPNIDPAFTIGAPMVLILVRPLAAPDPRWRGSGLHARLVSVERNSRKALDPAIKSGNYLNNILGLMEAREHGADLAIFRNAEGMLTESETSNLWIVKDGEIRTPHVESGILVGITRQYVLDLAARDGLRCREMELRDGDLVGADEVFVTSTTKDVCAVTRVDDRVVGDGTIGPVTRDLAQRFEAELDRLIAAEQGQA